MTDSAPIQKSITELTPRAQKLIRAYNKISGSCDPACCPRALAAVLDRIVLDNPRPFISRDGKELFQIAAELRGTNP